MKQENCQHQIVYVSESDLKETPIKDEAEKTIFFENTDKNYIKILNDCIEEINKESKEGRTYLVYCQYDYVLASLLKKRGYNINKGNMGELVIEWF